MRSRVQALAGLGRIHWREFRHGVGMDRDSRWWWCHHLRERTMLTVKFWTNLQSRGSLKITGDWDGLETDRLTRLPVICPISSTSTVSITSWCFWIHSRVKSWTLASGSQASFERDGLDRSEIYLRAVQH